MQPPPTEIIPSYTLARQWFRLPAMPAFSYRFTAGFYNPGPLTYNIQSLAKRRRLRNTSIPAKLIIQPWPWPQIVVSPALVIQQPDYDLPV